jgi:uncharacterized membrane protein
MLYTIAVILLVAWLLGLVGVYTIGSFVHVLLVLAIVLFLVGVLSGRRILG